MATASWPSELPQSPLIEDYEEITPDLSIRTPFDSGIDQVRPRFTNGVRSPLPMSFIMTTAQVAILDTFYMSTIKGSDAFDFKDPRTQQLVECRIKERPRYKPLGNGKWRVRCEFEALP